MLEKRLTADTVLDVLLKNAGAVGRGNVIRAYDLGVDLKVCRKAAYMLSRPLLFREAFRLLDKHIDEKQGRIPFKKLMEGR